MAEASGIQVVIDDDANDVRVDPVTGTVEHDQPDGGVIVRLDVPRQRKDDNGQDEWFRNLVDDIDGSELGRIAEQLIEAISADDNSRAEHLQIRARAMKFLGTKLEEPKGSVADVANGVEGMSSVTNPLMLDSLLKGWANAVGEFLPSNGPWKIQNDGDEAEADDDLAEALERDMNHYSTVVASEYYPDTSHMLLWGTYFGGSGFKKIYRCPMRRRPVSESVDEKDLIVSDTTRDLRSCARITHQIMMRPGIMKRMQVIGAYRKIALTQPTPSVNAVDSAIASIQGIATQKQRPEDQDYTIWETQCELELEQFVPKNSKFAGEGIPLPFLVTLDKDSREVLAIRRDWDEDDEECMRLRMYVKWPYIPGPGFYGTGLLNILGNASVAMTAAWREALDAGMYATFPGGLIDKSATRQNSSLFRLSPAEWHGIETGGRPISQLAMPMPYRDVTPGLMAMMDRITEQAKSVGGAADIPTAEGIQNVPVGTMLAQIEQATKVVAAAHKGMHVAQSEELELLLDLFRANPEDFWRSNRICQPGYWTQEKFLAALDNCNLVPRSDPNTPSHIHRVAKAVAETQLAQQPLFTPYMPIKDVVRNALRAIRSDLQLIDPQPQQQTPDPKAIAAQAQMLRAQTDQQLAAAKAASIPVQNEVAQDKLQAQRDIATIDLAKEHLIHDADATKVANQAAMEQRRHNLEVAKTVHGATMERHEGGLAMAKHGLEVDRDAHDRRMDVASHALDVHEATKPEPKPEKKP